MNRKSAILAVGMLMVSSLALPGFLSAEKRAQSRPEVIYDSYHDTSLPVREYSMAGPRGSRPREVEHPRPRRILSGAAVPVQDLAEQTYVAPPVSATVGLDFEGIPNSANGASLEGVPSDNNLAVGSKQVVETINTAWQVFDKATGKSLFGPQQISALFTGLPGLCGQGQTFFWTDPIVLYDQIAKRWIISQIAADTSFSTGNECIAVSESSDATGKYHRYVFKFGDKVFNDYDKLSVWPDAFYASYNLFGAKSFAAEACAYDRAAMLKGEKTKAVCFKNPNEFSFLPSNLDGATLPPSGEPSFFVDLASATSLHLFRFHVDFADASKSKFSGPITIPVKAYTMACSATGTCIPQPGTKQQLDSLGDRLMFRLAYRNFGDHEALVVNHSITANQSVAVRWYEFRNPS